MTPTSQEQRTPAALFFFLAPILFALVLFAALNVSCSRQAGPVSGEVSLYYTSDAGGRLDPCG